jgi:hypothetical protein
MFEMNDIIEFERRPIEEIRKNYKKLLLTIQESLNIDEEKAAIAISIMLDVCHNCYTDNLSCQCGNDE